MDPAVPQIAVGEQSKSAAPWFSAYPAPRSVAQPITRSELLRWLKEGNEAERDFVLVDLRRTDHEVSTIHFTYEQAPTFPYHPRTLTRI
jgi:hypothetical protein